MKRFAGPKMYCLQLNKKQICLAAALSHPWAALIFSFVWMGSEETLAAVDCPLFIENSRQSDF